MVSMTQLILVTIFASSLANEYTLLIQKKLFNGDKITDPPIPIKFSFSKGNVDISYDFQNPADKKYTGTTLYLANGQKQITEVAITDGEMTMTSWRKPWNMESEAITEKDSNWSPLKATFTLNADMVPKNITSISGSVYYTEGNEKGILNYYGIKNYYISEADRYVVENYMPVIVTE